MGSGMTGYGSRTYGEAGKPCRQRYLGLFGNVKGASPSDTAMKLSKIQLDEIDVHWEEQDLSYLNAATFAEKYWERVLRAELVPIDVDAKKLVAHKDVRIQYSD
jgi:hypothetical protein